MFNSNKSYVAYPWSEFLNKYLLYLFSFLLATWICCRAQAQSVFFRNLGVNDGLNATSFWYLTQDKNGFIWISSWEGLYRYDGYTIQQFNQATHPELPSDQISYLTCDSRNRIWIQTRRGVAMLDENRRMHTIHLPVSKINEPMDKMVFEAPGAGIVAITPEGAFIARNDITKWEPYHWLNRLIGDGGVVDIRYFDEDSRLLSVRNKKILLLNFREQKVIMDLPLPGAMSMCRINENEILAGNSRQWQLKRINIRQKKIIKEYNPIRNSDDRLIISGIPMMDMGADGYIYMTTRMDGLLRYNPATEELQHFGHDPLDAYSIGTNALRMVITNPNGLIAISSANGLMFANVRNAMIRHQFLFKDASGKMLENTVHGITADANGDLVFATASQIIRWDQKTGIATLLKDLNPVQVKMKRVITPQTVFTDDNGNIWAGCNGGGIYILDKNGREIKHLTNSLPTQDIRILQRLSNGQIMAGGENGLFLIDPSTFGIDTFMAHPALQQIRHKRIMDILPGKNEVWLALSPDGGVYHYNFLTKRMKVYDQINGLNSNRAYCLAIDKAGNIYAGTVLGLNIISPNGKITTIDKSSGLRNRAVESARSDKEGRIWFTNNNTLYCFDPLTKGLTQFGEQNGFLRTGFAFVCSYQSASGEIFFGTAKGIVSFNPDKMDPYEQHPELLVEYTTDGENYALANHSTSLSLPYREGRLNFRVSGADIINNEKLFFQYKMAGLDTGWSTPSPTRFIVYNLLPGNYSFQVRATYDHVNYVSSAPMIIAIEKPFWQSWWFRILVLSFILLGSYLFYQGRLRRIRSTLQVQKQMAELEAKALRAQMNPHFIFNSLNAIQETIVTGKNDVAFSYLSKFSRLLRMVLDHSDRNFIPLSKELEMINLYLSLESLRFSNSFTYYLEADESIDTEETMIPGFLVQPYAENAIWHGLRMKEGEKKLWIRFYPDNGDLVAEVEDNGIGREKAGALKKQKLGAGIFESKGTSLSLQRLAVLSRQQETSSTITFTDLKDEAGLPSGTKVSIRTRPINTKSR